MKNTLSAAMRNPLLVASIAFLVVAAVALPAQRAWEREVLVTMDQDAVIDYYRTEEGLARHLKNLEAAYRADTYGAATPEGTLELFRNALKDGDVELASKYYLIEDQNQGLRDLDEAKKFSTLSIIAEDIGRAMENSIKIDESRHRFFTLDKDGLQEFVFDLYLNPLTKIWKLEKI